MAVGYYNFSPIMQGNQTIANSFANLGQQIGQSIENHAQVQAAQALLPALQQSYQNGMQKIATGDPNGLADIYHSASTASQIPILRGFAQNALTTAQSANINAQHMLRTQAYLQGRGVSMMASHPEMFNPDGTFNASRLGQNAPSKPMTAYQQQESDIKNAQLKAKQVGLFSNLWNGLPAQGNNPATEGASTAYNNILGDIANGKAPSQGDLSKFASAYSQYQQTKGALGNYGIQDQNFENAFQQIQNQIPALNGMVKSEQAKGTDHFLGNFFGTNTDTSRVNALKQQIDQIKQLGGRSSQQPQSASGSSTQTLIQAVQAAQRHPDKVDLIKQRLQGAGIDPSMLDQAMKAQQSQQSSSPQASNMLPSASQVSSSGQENPEEEENAVEDTESGEVS